MANPVHNDIFDITKVQSENITISVTLAEHSAYCTYCIYLLVIMICIIISLELNKSCTFHDLYHDEWDGREGRRGMFLDLILYGYMYHLKYIR